MKPPLLALALGVAIIPGLAHAQAEEIDAGIESPGNQVFLVRNDRGVMQYDTRTTNPGSGPNDLSRTNLGPYMPQLTASFSYGGVKYLFLRTGQYVGLDANSENVVQRLSYIDNNNWPGLAPYGNKIEAALRFKGSTILFFLSDGQYIEYDMAQRNIAFGPIAMNAITLPSLQNVAGQITGAARWDNNRAVIFLRGQRHMWFNFRGVNASGLPTPNFGSQFAQPQVFAGGYQGGYQAPPVPQYQPPVPQPQWQQPQVWQPQAQRPQWQQPPVQQPQFQQPVGSPGTINRLTNKLNYTADTQTLAMRPDSHRIATGGWDNTLSIWDSSGQTLVHAVAISLQGRGDLLLDTAFSPNGQRIVTGSRQTGNTAEVTVNVWDASTGSQALILQGAPTGFCQSVAYDPQGLRIAAGCFSQTTGNAMVRVWDANNGAQLFQINGVDGPVTFSPDGNLLASASGATQEINIYNSRTSQLLQTLQGNAVSGIKKAVFTPDGTHLVTGNFNGTVTVWSIPTGQIVSSFSGHAGPVNDIAINRNVTRIASAGEDGRLILWDSSTGRQLSSYNGPKPLRNVLFNPDGDVVLTGGDENIIRIFAD
ncbi:hypothetical protein [Sphingorhabdus sp. M41]|uniref:hypothetical protein n=1 Tax=Sphingorhabdus sp. M41 TaxID=1806885 RepID=UPI0012E7732F|nr:hypothetical protein [Sphingorhabdus sp. M41]